MEGPLLGKLIPRNIDFSHALFIAIFKPSIARIKRKGDNGSPWRTPLVIRKSSVGALFTNTEALDEDKQHMIHCLQLLPNRI